MLKVGITGGMGSGKTTICRIFEVLLVPVYYADIEAKRLIQNDPQLILEIKAYFGEETYLPDNTLNRTLLADLVFNTPEALAKLNSLVHPAVKNDFLFWAKQQAAAPYIIKEAALIFESESYKVLDKVITVFTPSPIRINRVMERENMDKDSVLSRMKHQMPEEEKIRQNKFVL